jgi:RhtB (resistance to homoserine/threonine) family protein
MHEYWIEFGQVAAAHLLAVVSPGPDFAMVLRQSLGYGRRPAVWTSIGIGTAILVHVSYSLLGIGLLIKGSAFWFNTLKIAGAAYIGWMGVQALRAKPDHTVPSSGGRTPNGPTSRAAFVTGFLTNVLNPKATLFFVALFATVISGHTPRWIQVAYGAWMSVATMAWFCLVSFLVTRVDVRQSFVRYGHWVSRVLGVVLIGLAVGLVLTRGR